MKNSLQLISLFFIYYSSLFFLSCNSKETEKMKIYSNSDFYADTLLIPKDTVRLSDIKITISDHILKNGKAFSGYVKTVYDDHSISYTSVYKGIRQGYYRSFYPNGKLHEVRHYKNNKNTGRHYGYWSNGKMQFDYLYFEDKKVGYIKKWFENGTPYLSLHYIEDKEDGLQQGWRPNGKLFANYVVKKGIRYGLQESMLCYTLKNKEKIK
jgi:antitoxin component YwqK of YwqJK toxin-antitoxin module